MVTFRRTAKIIIIGCCILLAIFTPIIKDYVPSISYSLLALSMASFNFSDLMLELSNEDE